jgi:hypothetical protein
MFSTRFSNGQAGLKQSLVLIWLVLIFGWRGGPGCFVQFGALLKLLHANFKPFESKFNDDDPFRSMIWMDDLVVVEPDIRQRAIISLGIAEGVCHKLFGPLCLNQAKDLVEDLFETMKLTWGLIYDTSKLCRRLPDPKIEKAAFLLHMTSFDRGCSYLMFRLVQELRGCQEFWKSANPHLAPLCGFTNALLAIPAADGTAQPKGTLKQQAKAYSRFWDTIEMMRIMIATMENWEIRFTHSLTAAYSLSELMASPRFQHKVHHGSGDATRDRYAFMLWKTGPGNIQGQVVARECKEYHATLLEMIKQSEQEED